MTSQEREGGKPKDSEQTAFWRAARFASERPASRPYARVQDTIFRADCDPSSYRFLRDHVAVVGSTECLKPYRASRRWMY